MCLIGKAEHTMLVGKLYDGAQVGTDTVIGRVIDQNRLRIRVCFDGFFHFGNLHAKGDSKSGVTFRIYINWNGAAQHHCSHYTAVYVAGKNDLIAAFCYRENHSLHRGGGSSNHQKSVSSAEGFSGQLFGFPDNRNRMTEVIQRFHGVYVHADAFFAEQRDKFRVSASPLMTGNIEGNNPHFSKIFESLVDRCAALIEMVHDRTSFV